MTVAKLHLLVLLGLFDGLRGTEVLLPAAFDGCSVHELNESTSCHLNFAQLRAYKQQPTQSGGGVIYGVGTDKTVSSGSLSTMTPSSGWSIIGACCVTSIAISGNTMYGVGNDKAVWTKGMDTMTAEGGGDWTRFSAPSVIAIAIHDDTIYGVGQDNKIYTGSLSTMTPSSSWTSTGQCCVMSIAISGNTVYGVGMDNAVWTHPLDTIPGGVGTWTKSSKCCVSAIATYGGTLYGVGMDHQVYTTSLTGLNPESSNWNAFGPGNMIALVVYGGPPTTTPAPSTTALAMSTPAPAPSTTALAMSTLAPAPSTTALAMSTPAPAPSTPAPAMSTPAATTAESSSSSTCTIFGDPHIIAFDKTSNMGASFFSQFKIPQGVTTNMDVGDFWIVKSPLIHIQGRFNLSPKAHDDGSRLRVLAVGGAFLQNNTLRFGTRYAKTYWNDDEILPVLPSEYQNDLISAKYHAHAHLVQDASKSVPGVDVDLPMGVQLTLNRGAVENLGIAITVPKKLRNIDGECGNNNGVSSDDTDELISQRMQLLVAPEDALIRRPAKEFADMQSKH